jgi:hypothetical protein
VKLSMKSIEMDTNFHSTTLQERCRFAFRNCGRRCAEDFLKCLVLPFGGEPDLTVIVGGEPSNSFNLTYDQPRVWYIIPPELQATPPVDPLSASSEPQEAKLLTMIGVNFGVDLPLAYAGRVQSEPIGPYNWDLPNKLYDAAVIPVNASTIQWWDMAQYRTCFSIANKALPPIEGTPENKASLQRTCDAGVVLSEMTNLADMAMSFLGEDTPRYPNKSSRSLARSLSHSLTLSHLNQVPAAHDCQGTTGVSAKQAGVDGGKRARRVAGAALLR